MSDSFQFHASCKHSPPQWVLTPSLQLLSLKALKLSFYFSHTWEQTLLSLTSEHIPNITALPSSWPMCVPSQPGRPLSCPFNLDSVSLFSTQDINITTSLFYSEALTSILSESKCQPSHTGVWPDCLPFLSHCFPHAVFKVLGLASTSAWVYPPPLTLDGTGSTPSTLLELHEVTFSPRRPWIPYVNCLSHTFFLPPSLLFLSLDLSLSNKYLLVT